MKKILLGLVIGLVIGGELSMYCPEWPLVLVMIIIFGLTGTRMC